MNLSIFYNLRCRERWVAWRNGMLASPRFQKFAVRFPLTRGIARSRAMALFDLVAGFTYSQILAASVTTGMLELLSNGPLSASRIAELTELPVASAERLLRAAAALGLVESLGSRWALGSVGAALLGNCGVADMIAHHKTLYGDLAEPVGLLKRGGGELRRLWHYSDVTSPENAAAVASYSALMAASQPLVAEHAIASYNFKKNRKILDVGGGEGAFLTALATRHNHLDLALFDLPPVAERARLRLAQAGLQERSTVYGGNFLTDNLPGGYDVISLIRVLHDHDDAPAAKLLARICSALPEGGKLFIAEPMADTPGAERMGNAYFGFYLLAMGSGRPRSMAEIGNMLRASGFKRVRLLRTSLPLTVSAMVATK